MIKVGVLAKTAGTVILAFLVVLGFLSLLPNSTPTAPITSSPTPESNAVVASASPQINNLVKVARVIDGDTIRLEGGEVVRYIGIDAPESVDPRSAVQCFAKEAADKNRELVEGKEVRLEKDISETDKYDRLLRYIWLGDVLVNEYLAREGYAQSSSYPPDIKYQERFVEAQRLAQAEGKGLWGDVCKIASPLSKVSPSPVVKKTTSGSYVCSCSKTCAQMSSCDEAQYQLTVCGCGARDADKDGIACDSDCQ